MNRLRQFFHLIIPPSRQPTTARSAAALFTFLVVFIGGCLFVELRDILMFSEPLAFLLLLLTPWFWWTHLHGYSGLTGARSFMAQFMRLTIFGVFIMILADPRAVRKNSDLSVVFALDLSDSIKRETSNDALQYVVTQVAKKPEKDKAGLIVFGQDAAVELPPRVAFPFEAINTRLARDGTNIEKSLSLAAAMLPQDELGRIVLITDGVQTDGTLSGVLDDLNARETPVDVVEVGYNFGDEVWLEKMELPRFLKLGETYEAVVILSSLQDGAGTLVLEENGKQIHEQQVEYRAGKNRYTVPLYLRSAGYYEYVARIKPEKDGWEQNNIAINYLYLRGEGKVLMVTDPNGEPEDSRSMVKALRESKRDVQIMQSYELPRDPLSLTPYDCIVFANVPADAVDVVQMQAVHDAVYNLGTGFLMVGGKNSFGPGGFHRTPIEDALPVTMDITQKKVLPKGALAIVLHTCEFPEGNTWGKRITKQAIKVLGSQDEVGVLVFNWGGGGNQGVSWLFPLTPASETDMMFKKIDSAQIGDMPSFVPTMQMGLAGLQKSDAAVKHMIIISDGDPQPPPPATVAAFQQSQISITMIAVFPHGGNDISKMKSIASVTGGRYYFPQDPEQLPSIFIKEAKTLKKSMIQNVTFMPGVEFPSPILKGIDALPDQHGYVLTTARDRARTILRGPDSDQLDPILATWRYGVGKTAAFTADLSTNWGRDWVASDMYKPFVKQLVQDISRVDRKSYLHMRSFASGSTGVIVVEDFNPEETFLNIEAEISGPRNLKKKLALKQTAPRRYQAQFDLVGKGHYQILAAAGGGERKETAFSGFAVPYSPEYLRFRSNPGVLKMIRERTGGRALDPKNAEETAFVAPGKPKQSTRSIIDWLLPLLAILIPLDVGLRRVQIDIFVIRRWLGLDKRKPEHEETLGALLERKKQVQFVDDDKPARPMQTRPQIPKKKTQPKSGEAAKPPPVQVKDEKPQKKDDDDDGPVSTTSRLLAKKKKWDQ
jgi:uncharacterized membrane protein/Mg-chelatase subunit ChlD